MTILSTAYFPNIEYFSEFIFTDNLIEQFESFPKQTYRNRCHILSVNGKISLIVPVVKGRSGKIKTKDIKISYDYNWQHQHLKTIMSAYASAPFYDYYITDIHKILKKNHKFLIDLNNDILLTITDLLNIKKEIKLTDNFIPVIKNNFNDLRFSISPKIKSNFNGEKYIQVFSDRFEFIQNLSILDLIFNMGTDTETYLMNNYNALYNSTLN